MKVKIYYGQVSNNNDPSEMLVYEFNEKDKIITSQVDVDQIDTMFNQSDMDLPNNQNFKTETDISNLSGPEDSITPSCWWLGDGCLPGGSQHCGGKCRYGKQHGCNQEHQLIQQILVV
ncbi:hypothetical protein [Bacillus sp. SD088]|uniref:hypothetical protein n=1 Tax=Bacillus sp. SD088 TaxID=2782012 RepID=UPI001A969DAA|nr:hypothetical protein [Bacillus sp. SD088]MBO0994151.1 hypothetical protein [Bacillus sp. SD088]